MKGILTSNSVMIASLSPVLLLVLNPIIMSSSFAQPGPSNDSPHMTSEGDQILQNNAPGNKNLKDSNIMTSQSENQRGIFCIIGTGPGTGKNCIPCDPNNGLQKMSECVSPKGETMSQDTLDLPKSYSAWVKGGLQELEAEKKLPSGTGKALASFEQGDPKALLNVCKSISKDPGADVKAADCNSLTAKGEKAEETKLIIAGYTFGKLYEESENNSTDANTNNPNTNNPSTSK